MAYPTQFSAASGGAPGYDPSASPVSGSPIPYYTTYGSGSDTFANSKAQSKSNWKKWLAAAVGLAGSIALFHGAGGMEMLRYTNGAETKWRNIFTSVEGEADSMLKTAANNLKKWLPEDVAAATKTAENGGSHGEQALQTLKEKRAAYQEQLDKVKDEISTTSLNKLEIENEIVSLKQSLKTTKNDLAKIDLTTDASSFPTPDTISNESYTAAKQRFDDAKIKFDKAKNTLSTATKAKQERTALTEAEEALVEARSSLKDAHTVLSGLGTQNTALEKVVTDFEQNRTRVFEGHQKTISDALDDLATHNQTLQDLEKKTESLTSQQLAHTSDEALANIQHKHLKYQETLKELKRLQELQASTDKTIPILEKKEKVIQDILGNTRMFDQTGKYTGSSSFSKNPITKYFSNKKDAAEVAAAEELKELFSRSTRQEIEALQQKVKQEITSSTKLQNNLTVQIDTLNQMAEKTVAGTTHKTKSAYYPARLEDIKQKTIEQLTSEMNVLRVRGNQEGKIAELQKAIDEILTLSL